MSVCEVGMRGHLLSLELVYRLPPSRSCEMRHMNAGYGISY